MACPTFVSDGIPLGHGTVDEDTGYGTKGLGLSAGGTVLTVWDDVTFRNGNVPGGHPTLDEQGYTVLTFPGLDFIEHHAFGNLGDALFYPENLTTDDDGNVYYWTGESPIDRLIKQNGASWSVIDSTSRTNNYGPVWNPHDGLLYNIGTAFGDQILEWWDPVDGYVDDSIVPSGTGTDAPALTPDGAVWLSKPGAGSSSGLYRFAGGVWTSADHDEIPSIHSDSIPVAQADSSVMYRDNVFDRAILMQPDFSWVEVDCEPFTGDAPYFMDGMSRAAHAPDWSHTAFVAPSLGGFGWYLWDTAQPAPVGRFTIGRVGFHG